MFIFLATTNKKSDNLFIYFRISGFTAFFLFNSRMDVSHLLHTVRAKCILDDTSVPPGSIKDFNGEV